MSRYTYHERRIAKTLGVTDAGLEYLLKGRQRGNETMKLRAQGFLDNENELTPAGKAVIARARDMGY